MNSASVFIAELVAFVLIIAILLRYVSPLVQKGLRKQQDVIAQQVADAEEAKRRLAEAERAHQNAITEARTEAAQIRENARADAQRTVEELREQAHQEADRIVARSEEQLQSQRASVVRDLRVEIGTLAVELSEKIVEQRLEQEGQVSASVDAFLAGLESRDNTGDTTGRGTRS